MTELERWMNDHPPLADALTAEETAALRQKVLARCPKPRVLRGWRLAAAAAALCLVAAGAVVLGLFHPMSAANETNALVQKYGEVLDEPITFELSGHTVRVRALLRGKNTLRVLYDVDNAQGLDPRDLMWSTGNFNFIPTEESAANKWLYTATNFGTGFATATPSARGRLAAQSARARHSPVLWTFRCTAARPRRAPCGLAI